MIKTNKKVPKLTKDFWTGYQRGLHTAEKIVHQNMLSDIRKLTLLDRIALIFNPSQFLSVFQVEVCTDINDEIARNKENCQNDMP